MRRSSVRQRKKDHGDRISRMKFLKKGRIVRSEYRIKGLFLEEDVLELALKLGNVMRKVLIQAL